MHWRTGDTVAWRVRVRIEPERPEGEVGIVFPAIVVRDTTAEVAVYTAPGAIAKRRNHESGGPHGRVVLGVRDGYEDVVWRRWRRLLLRGPADGHTISLFWDDETDALRFWYIDLVTPLRRTAAGFEFVDHGIDVVVQPDLSSWEWMMRTSSSGTSSTTATPDPRPTTFARRESVRSRGFDASADATRNGSHGAPMQAGAYRHCRTAGTMRAN